MVLVDNKFVKGSNGVAKTSLPIGQHSFVVVCDGFESEEGTVKLKPTAPSNLQITLSKEETSASQMPQTVLPQQTQIQQFVEQNQIVSSTTSALNSSVLKNTDNSSGRVMVIPVKNGINIEMVKVEAGSFDMGATPEMEQLFDDEKTVHRVTLTNNFSVW